MIQLAKGPTPQVIVDHGADWTAVWVDHIENGSTIRDTDKTRYRHSEIKAKLRLETSEKCAYCESKITHAYPGDVEHILPKRKCPRLFVAWENLTLACGICNTRKSDYFDETQPLLNPYTDDPKEHLVFHGPVVFHVPGSSVGEMTQRRLELSRAQLVERRKERIEALKLLIDRWHSTRPGSLKDLLLSEIKKELSDDREFAGTLRAFAYDHAGIET